jgi:predicted GIY-YIG superfamily endonuclease
MPFATNLGYAFNADTIKNMVPASSGVYGLFNNKGWVYVGESKDIERRLLEHLNTSGTCISRANPTHCIWELSAEHTRVQRQNALILELGPPCNQMLG